MMAKGTVSTAPSKGAEDVSEWRRKGTQGYRWSRKTMDDHIKYVIHGRYNDLPQARATVVRIFLSSTFTDMAVERNALMKDVFPKLRTICRDKYGLEFQVVDMRWGVRDDASDDHSGGELCMREVRLCQRLSLGPTFVTFVGQRYGRCPLPRRIPATEMDQLLACMASEVDEFPEEDVQHVRNWYLLDKNALPSEYILQPNCAMIQQEDVQDQPDQDFESQRQKARVLWAKAEPLLVAYLRAAAEVAVNKEILSSDTARKYFRSVTEEEIVHGLMEDDDPNAHCLCFMRTIKAINLNHPKAWRFVDKLGSGETDVRSQKLLDELKNDKIERQLGTGNIFNFDITWSDNEGINEEEHADYLKQVCHTFETQMLRLIDEAYQKQKLSADDRLYVEVLEHAQQAISKVERFHGREDIISSIQEYIESDSKQPLVVYGESGCGKTSIMAKTAMQVCQWLGDSNDLVVITRFLGTTPDSSSVYSLVVSICEQLCRTTGLADKLKDIPKDFKDVKDFFLDLLDMIPKCHKVVLVLDSLDQLSSGDGAHRLKWIPQNLPPNVKLVVSTLPDEHGILKTLKASKIDDTQYVCVEEMPSATSKGILHAWLQRAGRTLSDEQQKAVEDALTSAARPIYVKLLFDEVASWQSYRTSDHLALPPTIRKCIENLFFELETKHGEILVKHAFGMLSASKNGLTETEMEDLLSLDDVVLNDVFQFHMPPIRRLPSILWSRIRNDISEYIVDREADGSKVMSWYHRQFIEAASHRYNKVHPSQNGYRRTGQLGENDYSDDKKDDQVLILECLYEYFSGKWAKGKEKPFLYTDQQVKKLALSSPEAAANRHVSDQPAIFGNPKESSDLINMRLNRRKTSELPSVLKRLHNITKEKEKLLDDLLFNVEFFIAWIATTSWNDIMGILEYASEQYLRRGEDENEIDPGMELNLLRQALLLSYTALYENPYMFGAAVSGRLLLYHGRLSHIDALLGAAENESLRHCALVAPHQQLDTPGGELLFMINNHLGPVYDAVWGGIESSISMSVSQKLVVIDMEQGEVVFDVKPRNMPEKDTFFKVRVSEDDTIWASLRDNPILYNFDPKTGDILHKIDLTEHGAEEGFTIEDIVPFSIKKGMHDRSLIVIWSKRHSQIFVIDNDKVTTTDSSIDRQPPIKVECMGTVYEEVFLVVVRRNMLVEVYQPSTRYKNKIILLWKFQLPQNGVTTKICIGEMLLVVGCDTGSLVIYPLHSLFTHGLVSLLGIDENDDLIDNSLFQSVHQLISLAVESGSPLPAIEPHILKDLPLAEWVKGSPPVIVIGTESAGRGIITCKLSDSISSISVYQKNPMGTILLVCTDRMLIALTLNQDQNNHRIMYKVKRTYTEAVFTDNMRFLIAYQGGSMDVFTVKRRAKRISLLVSLEAHAKPITKVLTVEMDFLFLTSSLDGTVKFWNLDKCGEHKALIPSFDRARTGIEKIESVVSQTGRHMALTSSPGSSTVELWDIMSGRLVRSISHPERFRLIQYCLVPSLDALVAIDELGTLLYWTIHDALDTSMKGSARLVKKDGIAPSPLTQDDILLMRPCGNKLDVIVVITSSSRLITIALDGGNNDRKEESSAKDLVHKSVDLSTLGVGNLSEAILREPDTLLLLSSDRCVLFQYFISEGKLSKASQVSALFGDAGSILDMKRVTLLGLPHATLLRSSSHLLILKENMDDTRTVSSEGPQRCICTSRDGDAMAFTEGEHTVKVLYQGEERHHKVPSTIKHMAMTPDGQYLVYVYAEKHVRLLRLRDMRVVAWYTMSDIIHALQVSHNSWFVLLGTADRRLFVLLIADVEMTQHRERIPAVRAYNPAHSEEQVRALVGEVMRNDISSSDATSSDDEDGDKRSELADDNVGSPQLLEMDEHHLTRSITRTKSALQRKMVELRLEGELSDSCSESEDETRDQRKRKKRPSGQSPRNTPTPPPEDDAKRHNRIGDIIQEGASPFSASTGQVSVVTTTRMCAIL